MADNAIKGSFIFERDTKRYHRFEVMTDEGVVTGTVYIRKNLEPIPVRLILDYRSKEKAL
jgi:hypothetical protein